MTTAAHEPRCGMCRYRVRGLPTFRCPECGNDLRMVGISVTGAGVQASRWQRVGYWTLLFAVAAVPLWMLAPTVIPGPGIAYRSLIASGDAYEIRLVVIGGWTPGRRVVVLELQGLHSGPMIIHHSLAYTASIGRALERGNAITEQAIESWLAGNGREPGPQEALDLLAMVRAGIDGDLFARPPVYFQQRPGALQTYTKAPEPRIIVGVLAAVWIAGAWVTWRRSPVRPKAAQSSIA